MELQRFSHNQLRIFILGLLGASILLLLTFPDLHHSTEKWPSHSELLSPPSAEVEVQRGLTDQGFLPFEQAAEFCDRRRYRPYPDRHRRRKVYDLILLNTELDWLEIRLGQLYDDVDYFIIMESDKTFTGNPKPLTIKNNWGRFKHYHSKMIRFTLDDSELSSTTSTWDREKFSRDAMLDQGAAHLKGEASISAGDVILVSDVDEIPRPETLRTLRNCEFPSRLTLMSNMYYYSFQWALRDTWEHPQATYFQGDKTVKPEDLRNGDHTDKLYHAAWHCSYCFSTLAELVQKVVAFSHTEYNKPEFKERGAILNRVRNGLDFFDRSDSHFDRIENNPDIPLVLERNREKWAFALDRDEYDGNFRDWTPEDSQYQATI